MSVCTRLCLALFWIILVLAGLSSCPCMPLRSKAMPAEMAPQRRRAAGQVWVLEHPQMWNDPTVGMDVGACAPRQRPDGLKIDRYRSQMDPRSTPDRAHIDPGWTPNRPRIDPSAFSAFDHWNSRRAQNGTAGLQIDPISTNVMGCGDPKRCGDFWCCGPSSGSGGAMGRR